MLVLVSYLGQEAFVLEVAGGQQHDRGEGRDVAEQAEEGGL